MQNLDWQLAGLTTEEGVVGRRVQPFRLRVPLDLWIERDHLVWTDTYHDDPECDRNKRVTTSQETMDSFLNLSDGTSEEILRYAMRWGPIGFCKHGLPVSHKSRWGPDRTGTTTCHLIGGPDRFREPLKFWRLTSRRAQALLNIGARLSDDEPGKEEDWKILDCAFVNPGNRHEWRVVNQRDTLAWQLTRWMQMGLVVPVVTFRKTLLSFSLDAMLGSRLFGVLAYQLALAVSSTDGLAICSACSGTYIPTRRPTLGRRTYCPSCRKRGKPIRDASRAYRQRKHQSAS